MTAESQKDGHFLGQGPGTFLNADLRGNVYQMAILNNMLPQGFRFEQMDVLKKNADKSHSKKKKITGKRRDESYGDFQSEERLEAESSSIMSSKKAAQKGDSKRHANREKNAIAHEEVRFDDRKDTKGNDANKMCEKILMLIKQHQHAHYFMNQANMPGILEEAKEKMDLMKVDAKLRAGAYPTTQMFARDMRMIWSNSLLSNEVGSPIYTAASEINNYFDKLWSEVGNRPLYSGGFNEIQEPKKDSHKMKETVKQLPVIQSRPPVVVPAVAKSTMDKPMTHAEKTALRNNIMKMTPENMNGIVKILEDTLDTSNRSTLVFDIDSLPTRKCRELEQYVKKTLSQPSKTNIKKNVQESRPPYIPKADPPVVSQSPPPVPPPVERPSTQTLSKAPISSSTIPAKQQQDQLWKGGR